jgi:hypothetical protein
MKKIARENFENNLDHIRKSGRGTFSSSNFDIRLKYLFNQSHLSSSPYTISSKFSSFIEFLRGGKIIFSKSLRQCKYPSSWKNAHVTAIFKKGDSSLPSYYRPISLNSCVGKVMERFIEAT